MTIRDQLASLEERFWTGDADFYRDHLADDALMAFPQPVGMLTRDATIRSIEDAPRWRDVGIHDAQVVRLTDESAVLAYRALARRGPDEPPYSAQVSSVYVRRDGSWRLAFHQQTPVGSPTEG